MELIATRRGRPRQANLRRAASSAYYALFHCLATSNANMLVGANRSRRSEGAWTQTYRALQHGTARSRCENRKMLSLFPPVIQEFADVFIMMQIERNEADYDPNRRFLSDDVKWAIAEAYVAIEEFRAVDARHRRAFLSTSCSTGGTNRSSTRPSRPSGGNRDAKLEPQRPTGYAELNDPARWPSAIAIRRRLRGRPACAPHPPDS